MSFVHDDPDFDDLLRIVAGRRKLSLGLVEKDYWVIHTLWALDAAGFEVWFKGGTSLSKGFGLIERFSEDLDLKLEPGKVTALPRVDNWKSEGTKSVAERKAYFESLETILDVPGASSKRDADATDKSWRSASMRVHYPGRHLADLGGILKPFVLLEIGNARVTPYVERDMSSFVHEYLTDTDQLGTFTDNRPRRIRCVHPLVTLLEKLDALRRRVTNEKAEPAAFVRHFEDAARVIAAAASLPPLAGYESVRMLAKDMLDQKQISGLPAPTDAAFTPEVNSRWDRIRAAHAAITPMFWGTRISLEDACATIRSWLSSTFLA